MTFIISSLTCPVVTFQQDGWKVTLWRFDCNVRSNKHYISMSLYYYFNNITKFGIIIIIIAAQNNWLQWQPCFDNTLQSDLSTILNVAINDTHCLSEMLLGSRQQWHSDEWHHMKRVIKRTQIPPVKEQVGLRRDRKCPVTWIFWTKGKSILWNITVPDTCRVSFEFTATEQGAAK